MRPFRLSGVLLLLPLTELSAQQIALPAGGEATGAGGYLSFSVGQVADVTATGIGGFVAQGVQQTYDDLSTGAHVDLPPAMVTLSPTITSDLVQVLAHDVACHMMHITLLDAAGRALTQRTVAGPVAELSLAMLAAGSYHVRVTIDAAHAATFRLIKINAP